MGVHQLVKLVYLADREGLIRHGRPVTYDAYVSIQWGPVPSSTLNLANRDLPFDMWARLISERKHNDVSLIVDASDVPTDRLSKAERDLIIEVYQRFGHMDFEHLTLLAVLRLDKEAYGARIQRELEEQGGREASVSAVYITLTRLEGKGLVTSWMGPPTEARGGKAKRHFKATPAGLRALSESRDRLIRMWSGVEHAMSAAGKVDDAK